MNNQVPEPVVGIFILNTQGELLLVKSHKWHGQYIVPGGHIEFGEKMEDTVAREAKEETGLDVFDFKLLTVCQYLDEGEFYKQGKNFIMLQFLAKTSGGEVRLNDEAEEYVWVAPRKSLELDLYKHTRQTIKDYLLK
jgi:nucleoside triphosphatase